MIMMDQSKRLSQPLRWGRREKSVVAVLLACVVIALLGLLAYGLTSGAPARADCIERHLRQHPRRRPHPRLRRARPHDLRLLQQLQGHRNLNARRVPPRRFRAAAPLAQLRDPHKSSQ